ncbi:MAG: TetR/AcrR family transcriptional regulator [Oscillospiraceae bacterium]|nr:TetR/AcrR family transcriptional regulator [Oscillospiraceae bacterium]
MLIKGTEDLRIQKTMAAIKESFEALICEKDFHEITVTELCTRAMINKKTFYHYYPTLDDLLEEMQMELSSAYIELVKDYKLPEDAEKVNRIFFEYSAAQGLAYEKITCSSGSYAASQKAMNAAVMDATWGKSPAFQRLSREEQNLVLAFINTFGVGCYRQWVADGKKVPLERVIELSGTLMCGGLDRFFKTKKEK